MRRSQLLKLFIVLCTAIYSAHLFAYSNQPKPTHNSSYKFLNQLNQTLNNEVSESDRFGVKHLSTIQKNSQIIVQIIHNPLVSFEHLVEGIAQSASRVNGVSFQNNFTLNILDIYCKNDLFYKIQLRGLNQEVKINYENHRHKPIATHRINRSLCQ